MGFKNKFLNCRKGLETVTGVFMLLLMFATIVGFLVAFQNYNTSIEQQMDRNKARSQENILISKQIDPISNTITGIRIINAGTKEVIIRALYITPPSGQTVFKDPSISYNTLIQPSKDLIISSSDLSTTSLSADTKIIASTELGVQAIAIPTPSPTPTPAPPPDLDTFVYGALKLRFSEFLYRNLADPPNAWHPGWQVPGKISCEWKIEVTNVGAYDLTITQVSCLTTVSDTTSSGKSWNLNTASMSLPKGNPVNVIYVNPTEKVYDSGTCMVFLTFFGHYNDATLTPYAQTIPFEALTIT